MRENSDCSSYSNYSSDGCNNSNDWKTQFQYVSGNLNKNKKIENLEQTYKQRQNQTYKKNMRTRRNNWKNLASLEQVEKTDSHYCKCNCQKQKKVDNPMVPILSEMLKRIETNLLQRKEFL